MGSSRGWIALIAGLTGAALAGCGDTAATTPSATQVVATPSTATAGGALAGFLAAATAEDNLQVPVWLATSVDSTDLGELLRVYADFGTTGGLFWEVGGVTVTGVTTVDATHADVALSGPVVWCLGKAPGDPAATCSQVTGVPARQDTYSAIDVDGQWKADIDVNASGGLDHNPQASPTAGAPTPSPT
ncbi:MAG TPA: hypothetical protein VG520_09650 [Candidatus Dormibacteraeota bacterium]|jgi:hypothetical protein|nr:hypothetical protein [Candidatus Dormibacteraeota bacterium]